MPHMDASGLIFVYLNRKNLKIIPMKTNVSTRNSLLWGVLALVVGIIIALNPADAITLTIRLIGLLVLAIGIVQLISFIEMKRRANLSWAAIPFGGVVGFLFGLLLLINPELFQGFVMYLIAAFIILLGIWQISSIIKVRKAGAKAGVSYFIFPVLLTLAGVVIIWNPFTVSNIVGIFAGVWIALFGLSEIFAYFAIKIPQSTDDNAN